MTYDGLKDGGHLFAFALCFSRLRNGKSIAAEYTKQSENKKRAPGERGGSGIHLHQIQDEEVRLCGEQDLCS